MKDSFFLKFEFRDLSRGLRVATILDVSAIFYCYDVRLKYNVIIICMYIFIKALKYLSQLADRNNQRYLTLVDMRELRRYPLFFSYFD